MASRDRLRYFTIQRRTFNPPPSPGWIKLKTYGAGTCVPAMGSWSAYEVTCRFHGSTASARYVTLKQCMEFAREMGDNSPLLYTWEEVTDNGRFSCE